MELISKQAIIDRLDYVIEHGAPNSRGLHPLSAEAVREMVEQLPPANNSEIPNSSDTISRQAAIEAIEEYMVGKRCDTDGTMMARLVIDRVIKKLPPTGPQIIHCKDCRLRNEIDKEIDIWRPCRAIVTPDNFSCIRAESASGEVTE